MSSPLLFADLHVHPSLKPFASSSDPEQRPNMWQPLPVSPLGSKVAKGLFRKSIEENLHGSQSSLTQLRDANCRMLLLNITPVEHPFYYLRKALGTVMGKKLVKVGAAIGNMDYEVVRSKAKGKKQKPICYFNELMEEYDYVKKQAAYETEKRKLRIVGDYDEMQRVLGEDDYGLAAILSIEGAHSLINFKEVEDYALPIVRWNSPQGEKFQQYEAMLQTHITEVKRWGDGRHAPLYMTFSHHFWNLLAGHAKSLSDFAGTYVVNQRQGMGTGFTDLGRGVLQQLLSRDNGRRILIDAKHLSVPSRKELWQTLQHDYWKKGDPVPVVHSHAAVNGYATFDESLLERNNSKKLRNSYFNNWSINVSDEEILLLHRSKGLLGLMLHEERVPGGLVLEKVKALRKELNGSKKGQAWYNDRIRQIYTELLAANLLHIARVVRSQTAWELPCLGSDFDGVMRAFPPYASADDLQNLGNDLLEFFHYPSDIPEAGFTVRDIKRLMFGLSPEEIVERFAHRNLLEFLQRYFHDAYLLNGKPAA